MAEEEARLGPQIEQLVGGKLVSLERQARWRKAWYAVVERQGDPVPIYVRGDKQLDAEPYPGLDREAAILRLFRANGLPVPRVYGMSADPVGIVMERVAGTRDVDSAADDAERRRVAEQYVEVLARMHALDTAPFVAAGVVRPEGPAAIALSYLNANIALYRRTKQGAQPLVEFALRWMQRNVPMHRRRACVLHGDPGQFLFDAGQLTCIYDFEAAHIGDPLADLAALRTRHGTEPLGADPAYLIRHYASITGQAPDLPALSFHTAAFMLTAVMALAGPLTDPRPQELQLEYLTWELMTRRAMLWAMAECLHVTITPPPLVRPPEGRSALVARVLDATIERIEPKTAAAAVDKASTAALVDWARGQAAAGAAHEAADLDRVARILGCRPADWREADAALERFVIEAGPEHDRMLFDYFAAQTEDRVAEALSIQPRLSHYALPRIRL
ncbi:MAG TPA: phosphotransferase family protein [Steroidobacteraceae bacterium]